MTVAALIDLHLGGRLDLEPGFQRDSVWSAKQRSDLIDSILRNYPIPAIFLYKCQRNGEPISCVLDGKQRIETILRFTGKLRRSPGCNWDGRANVVIAESDRQEPISWRVLNKRQEQYKMLDYRVQVIEVDGEWGDAVRLFVRLNTTGKPLHPQEIRNAKFLGSEFLKRAKKLANKHESYLRVCGIVSAQQAKRMKHIELMCELIYAAHIRDVGDKKAILDRALGKESTLKGNALNAAAGAAESGINRLQKMFPDLGRSVRFHKISDFYSLAVLIQKFQREGYVLTDPKRNSVAWRLLVEFGTQVDRLNESVRKLETLKLTEGQELARVYLQTVKEGVDAASHRRKREHILAGILEGPLHVPKDVNRLFSEQQRRIIWNSAAERVYADCGKELDWGDFHIDHVKPHSRGGLTNLVNAAIMCPHDNRRKGAK
jgi:hypothetical protein